MRPRARVAPRGAAEGAGRVGRQRREVGPVRVDVVGQSTSQAEPAVAAAWSTGAVAEGLAGAGGVLGAFSGMIGVFVVAFVVTLMMTPVFRRLAIANGVIDRPDEQRKAHKFPVAYLGGVAVFLGLMAGIGFSYLAPLHGLLDFVAVPADKPEWLTEVGTPRMVPLSVILGMTVIMVVGLLDDVADVSPAQKVGGMLIASAALAYEDVGVKLAAQVLRPIGAWLGNPDLLYEIPLPFGLGLGGASVSVLQVDVIYWTGTGVIAVFVLGACNAMNLIDGLDGLCSGVSALAASALLVVSVGLGLAGHGELDNARIVLCLALLGASLGFLPHNYNPASIFLGDAGSLLLGFTTIVIVLSLGDEGRTNLVLAGLVIFAVPIIDTSLAIVRRKMAGQKISAADDQHLHHILKRALGVKGAVAILHLLGAVFGVLGIALTLTRSRVAYVMVLVLVSFVAVIALKAARRKQFEEEATRARAGGAAAGPANGVHAGGSAVGASDPA
ncbi:MAG: hypothetical protein C0468_06650 [Planctomyces sp.]|nr:hypothetical protein [Planctomyces sp.]MBA4120263.1 hypothetical protein [Isosphaera sp.]